MKKLTALVLSFILAIPFINISGFAEEVNEVNTKVVVNSDNGEVSLDLRIWGETTTKSQERVSVKILRPDVDEANPDLSLFEKYAYIDQTKSDASGNYSFDIEFNEDSGEYTIIVIDSKGIIDEKKILTPSSSQMTDFFTSVNSKEFEDDITMDEYLQEYAKDIGIDISLYVQLEPSVRDEICDSILENTYDDMSVLYTELDKTILLTGVDSTKSNELIGKLIAYYDRDIIKISEHEMYPLYSALKDSGKNAVHKMISTYEINAVDDIKTAFVESVFTNEVKNVDNYKEIGVVIDSYKEYVDFDITSYKKLTSKKQDKVLYYVSKEFSSIDNFSDFVAELDETVENIDKLIKEENKENSSSGGGGGGGGSSSSSKDTTITMDSTATPELPPMVDTGNEYEEKETEVVIPDYEGADIFVDLTAVEWARTAILDLNSKGILSGREDKKFYPNENTTRAEFIKMIITSMKISDDERAMSFSDVNESDWFYPYIKAAYSNGLINGIGNGLFGPNDKITRQDASTIIYKAMTLKNYITLAQVDAKSINDYNTISDYAKNAVLMLKSYGVINGYTDGSFKPKRNITRAECAAMIYNVMNSETYLDATREYVSATDGLLDIGYAKVVNQFTKHASKDLSDARYYDLDSETDYVGQIRNQNISTLNSEYNVTMLYLDFDISHLKEGYDISRGFIDIVVKANVTENYYPEDVKICAYAFDSEGKNKRFATDKSYLGNMLDSKMIYKEFKEVKSNGFNIITLEVTEAVLDAVKAGSDTVRVVLSLDSNELKGYTDQILKGTNTFTATDFSFGVVLNTKATRQHDGTTIVYGNAQPVLNLYN